MQVNNQAGLTFEAGLRAPLRQDPDIIMVGETRDVETASISRACGDHGASCIFNVTRIMRHPPLSVWKTWTDALHGVKFADRDRRAEADAQGPSGRYEEAPPTEEEVMMLGGSTERIRRANGCPLCNYTGYRGATAIHEIPLIDREVRKMIMDGASVEAIQNYAVSSQGMKTLKECAVGLVKQGITTIEELRKVAYYA